MTEGRQKMGNERKKKKTKERTTERTMITVSTLISENNNKNIYINTITCLRNVTLNKQRACISILVQRNLLIIRIGLVNMYRKGNILHINYYLIILFRNASLSVRSKPDKYKQNNNYIFLRCFLPDVWNLQHT